MGNASTTSRAGVSIELSQNAFVAMMAIAFFPVLWQSRVTQQRPFCCSIDRSYIMSADFTDEPEKAFFQH